MAATKIRPAFEDLVRKLQENKLARVRIGRPLILITTALEARREAVKHQLTDKNNYEIGKAKAKYPYIKGASVAAPYLKKAASDVKDATQTKAQLLGNTAEKVGSEIKETTK